jgi:hypothetical protein
MGGCEEEVDPGLVGHSRKRVSNDAFGCESACTNYGA